MKQRTERGRRSPGRKPAAAAKRSDTPAPRRLFHVTALGAGGDGIARTEDGSGPVFIPFTAPGDMVLARQTRPDRAVAEEIVTPSPDRVTPPCSLAGVCGGCAFQHLSPAWTLAWKKEQILQGLKQAGAESPADVSCFQTPPLSRRRADLAIRRTPDGIVTGLHQRGGDPVQLHDCQVIAPAIQRLLPPLQDLLRGAALLKREGSVLINLLSSGPDLLLTTDAEPGTQDRMAFADFAKKQGIPRIAWRRLNTQDAPESLAQIAPAVIRFDGAEVSPPPGAFLQATGEGEAAIRQAVLDGLPRIPGKKSRVVELYAGCGTLTFPLASRVRVEAWEGYAPAVQALQRAAAGHRISAAVRDLARQPVDATEMAGAVAVVLDPPHSGAGIQLGQILAARPPVILYVSCNPRVLFRDTAALLKQGYQLDRVTIVDQFLWSPEIETVCRFSLRRR